MMTQSEIEDITFKMGKATSAVKMVCCVANNAAWLVALDGLDHARRCKGYKHEVKRAFSLAVKEWHNYENALVYATQNNMFRVENLAKEARDMLGNITDWEYYEFWQGGGVETYKATKPLITSLWNKHRLSLIDHGVDEADHIAWVLTGCAALTLAIRLYESVTRSVIKSYNVHKRIVYSLFDQFSIGRVEAAWKKAMFTLCPGLSYDLNPTEKRNISLGIAQLCEAWTNPNIIYSAHLKSIEEYGEIFKSRGFQKKALLLTMKAMQNTLKDIDEDYDGRKKQPAETSDAGGTNVGGCQAVSP